MSYLQMILRIMGQVIRSQAASTLARHAIRAATVEVVREIRNRTGKAKTPATFH